MKTVTLEADEALALEKSNQMFSYFERYFKEVTLPRAKADRDDVLGRQSEFVDWMNSIKRLGNKIQQLPLDR